MHAWPTESVRLQTILYLFCFSDAAQAAAAAKASPPQPSNTAALVTMAPDAPASGTGAGRPASGVGKKRAASGVDAAAAGALRASTASNVLPAAPATGGKAGAAAVAARLSAQANAAFNAAASVSKPFKLPTAGGGKAAGAKLSQRPFLLLPVSSLTFFHSNSSSLVTHSPSTPPANLLT